VIDGNGAVGESDLQEKETESAPCEMNEERRKDGREERRAQHRACLALNEALRCRCRALCSHLTDSRLQFSYGTALRLLASSQQLERPLGATRLAQGEQGGRGSSGRPREADWGEVSSHPTC
jgi:hypothetical protein